MVKKQLINRLNKCLSKDLTTVASVVYSDENGIYWTDGYTAVKVHGKPGRHGIFDGWAGGEEVARFAPERIREYAHRIDRLVDAMGATQIPIPNYKFGVRNAKEWYVIFAENHTVALRSEAYECVTTIAHELPKECSVRLDRLEWLQGFAKLLDESEFYLTPKTMLLHGICGNVEISVVLATDPDATLPTLPTYRKVTAGEEMPESLTDNTPDDDVTVYDIVASYLAGLNCNVSDNGQGGLNIECPYECKEEIKRLGAMWSPRYYRWYLRADRLIKAARIIKEAA